MMRYVRLRDNGQNAPPLKEIQMKTYVLEVGGDAVVAFRAKDDTDAAEWIAPHSNFAQLEGRVTVRPATFPERAKWTEQSLMEANPNGAVVLLEGLD
jgi:hypothetical protein